MKKSLCICVIVLVVALVSFPFAYKRIDIERETIVITEEVISGDPVWAEGVTLQFLTHWEQHALWDTKYTIGSGETETEFTFAEDGVIWSRSESEYLDFNVPLHFGTAVAVGASVEENAVDIYDMWIPEVLEDVASRTKPGESHTEEVSLADYYAYLPIDVSALSGKRDVSYYSSNGTETFADFFRVPALEEEIVEVSVTKSESGIVIGVKCNQSAFGMMADSTCYYGEDGCFFTFVCADFETGERLNLGENSGLFYVPYAERNYGRRTMDFDSVKKICELPEAALPAQLIWDEEKEKVYMAAEVGEEYRLSVYDVGETNAKLLTEITVLEKSASAEKLPYWADMTLEENGILLKWQDGSFSFVIEDNGKYELWCSNRFVPGINVMSEAESMGIPLSKIDSLNDIFQYEHALCFDGERLILGCYESWESVNMTVAVYNRQEQLYCGIYHHSAELDWQLRGNERIEVQGMQNERVEMQITME